jgi:CRISPR-associated protein Cas5h
MKLISFDLNADMGFLKKPDINEKIYLTYNILHKPALLGILGAIAGYKGYEENSKFPEYYQKLKHLKIGLEPLNSDKGNYSKTIITYSNTTGLASNEDGGNLIVTEQTLLKPSFRCYLLLDTKNNNERILYERILSQEAEYLPYLGKNDFSAWWDKGCVKEYDYKEFDFTTDFYVSSIFLKESAVVNHLVKLSSRQDREEVENRFFYFERLPIDFDESLFQYRLGDFVYSNARFDKEMRFDHNSQFYLLDSSLVIQLF